MLSKLVWILTMFGGKKRGSRDGAVVRALASHQCGPGSIPGPGVICGLSLLLVLVFAPRGFSPGTPVFPSPQKPTFPNSNSIRNPRATGLSVPDCQVSPSLNKVDLFYLFYHQEIRASGFRRFAIASVFSEGLLHISTVFKNINSTNFVNQSSCVF